MQFVGVQGGKVMGHDVGDRRQGHALTLML
jgi:hypothetical protein